jgi:hypothetical protein
MQLPNYRGYKDEREKWEEAGRPVRSPERIKEIYDICKECENYIFIVPKLGQCKICTCLLRPKGETMNKIAMATTNCPLDPPKWVAENSDQETIIQPEQSAPIQYIKRPQREGNCGCH